MASKIDEIRDADTGKLPTYAWPGGYQMFYVTHDGETICPGCANKEIDDVETVIAYDTNWEDPFLICDDCGERIPSCYAEDEWEASQVK